MRLFELDGQYTNDLLDAAINIIFTASAEGQDSISTRDMISDLAAEGYMVNVRDLIGMLEDNPIVTSISKDSIEIDAGINDTEADKFTGKSKEEENKELVSKMAQKQINKDI